MKRSGPVVRTTPMPRSSGFTPRTAGPARVPEPRAAQKYTGPTQAVKALVHARDGAVCVPGITCGHQGQDLVWHHRANRGSGGSTAPWINLPSNGLTACRLCNQALEDARPEYYATGWKVHRNGILLPAEVPVRYPDGTWWMLDNNGRREPVPIPTDWIDRP